MEVCAITFAVFYLVMETLFGEPNVSVNRRSSSIHLRD